MNVGAVIIGDEVLSGKIDDLNTPRLIAFCRDVGAQLTRISVIGDQPLDIAEVVGASAARHDWVITSGGLGPTHDDRTVEAIAEAFGVAVVQDPVLDKLVRDYFGAHLTDAALKMAQVPQGTVLVGEGPFPTISFRNIYILPGVPQMFAAKLQLLAGRLRGHKPVVQRIKIAANESDIADLLTAVDRDFSAVKIGSYPTFTAGDHRVLVTVEGASADLVEQAVAAIAGQLLPTQLVAVLK